MNKKEHIYHEGRDIRKNVFVMGDILQDIRMIDESRHENVVKVGFLNDRERDGHLMEEYLDTFDIVILDDGTLLPVVFLISRMVGDEVDEEVITVLKAGKEYEKLESLFNE